MYKNYHLVKSKSSAENVELIKWCRKAFGERGTGWDYIVSTKGNIVVMIWYDQYEVMWQMWKE